MNVLLVCEGNICRSPIAEAIFLDHLGSSCLVRSAGISAPLGRPAHPFSVEVCAAHGLDITRHRTKLLDAELLRTSDVVLVMETSQVHRLVSIYPWASGRIWRVGHPFGVDHPDLLGQTRDAYDNFFNSMTQAIKAWENQLRT